jgi:hypothetical protein
MCVDDGLPRFHRAKNVDGETADYTRSAHLMSSQTKHRLDDIDLGILAFSQEGGWQESDSLNAIINMRARGEFIRARRILARKYAKRRPPQHNNVLFKQVA